jgi:hypothetical protein
MLDLIGVLVLAQGLGHPDDGVGTDAVGMGGGVQAGTG